MESFKNLKKETKSGLTISLALCLVEFVLGFVLGFKSTSISSRIHELGGSVFIILIIYYAVVGYKKPHGNLLKVLFIVFGFYIVFFTTIDKTDFYSYAINCCTAITALIIAYVSGRLDKINKNRVLMIIAGILLTIGAVFAVLYFFNTNVPINLTTINGAIAPVLIYASLGFVYTARYEEHKEAGLEDK